MGRYVLVHLDLDLVDTLFAEPSRRVPLSRRDAWADLHLRATREGEVRATSRELADAWEWSQSAVQRFIGELVGAAQVEVVRRGPARSGQVLVLVEMRERLNRRLKTDSIVDSKKSSNGAGVHGGADSIGDSKLTQSLTHVIEELQKVEPPPSGVGDAPVRTRTHARSAPADDDAPAPRPPHSETHRRFRPVEVERVLDALVAAGVPADCRESERRSVQALLRQYAPEVLVRAARGLPKHRIVTGGARPLSAAVLSLPSMVTECAALAAETPGGGVRLPDEVEGWRRRVEERLAADRKASTDLDIEARREAASVGHWMERDPPPGAETPKARAALARLAVLAWYGKRIHDPIPEEGRALLRTG